MKLKFEKGLIPEIVAYAFADFIEKNDIIIGGVTMYVQTFDKEGNAIKDEDEQVFVLTPEAAAVNDYTEYVAQIRRKAIRAVI